PAAFHRAVAAAAERLPTSHRYLSFDFALRRFLRDVRRPALERHLRWMGSFAPETLSSLLVPQVQHEILDPEPYTEAYDGIAPLRPRSARAIATALDLIFYLSEDNLVQADRSSGVRAARPPPATHGQPWQGALDAVHVPPLRRRLLRSMGRRALPVLVVASPLVFWRLGRPGFSDTGGMFAEPAREMVGTADW